MFQFAFDGALFKLEAKAPASNPARQRPPQNKQRTPDDDQHPSQKYVALDPPAITRNMPALSPNSILEMYAAL